MDNQSFRLDLKILFLTVKMEITYGVCNKRELQQHQKLLETLNIVILDIAQTISAISRQWVRKYGLSYIHTVLC